MKIVFADSLTSVSAPHWDNLVDDTNPFIQHDFLLALEQHDCLEPWGWHPQHCLLYDGDTLIGACPAYLKDNSYGEFILLCSICIIDLLTDWSILFNILNVMDF